MQFTQLSSFQATHFFTKQFPISSVLDTSWNHFQTLYWPSSQKTHFHITTGYHTGFLAAISLHVFVKKLDVKFIGPFPAIIQINPVPICPQLPDNTGNGPYFLEFPPKPGMLPCRLLTEENRRFEAECVLCSWNAY